MLFPKSHPWTPLQKRLIAAAIVAGLAFLSSGIYVYERYYRGPSDSVLFGIWQMPPYNEYSLCFDLKSDHSLQIRSCYGPQLFSRGRWYAGGSNIYLSIVNENDAAIQEIRRPVILHIVDIQPDTLRINGLIDEVETFRRFPEQASNQSMKPTASRCAARLK